MTPCSSLASHRCAVSIQEDAAGRCSAMSLAFVDGESVADA